jgi:hypothetical protein
LLSGLIFVIIGITFLISSLSYNFGNSSMPGPGYFPFILSCILILIGIIKIFKNISWT